MNITYAVIACVIVGAIILHYREDKPKTTLCNAEYGDRWGREAKEKEDE